MITAWRARRLGPTLSLLQLLPLPVHRRSLALPRKKTKADEIGGSPLVVVALQDEIALAAEMVLTLAARGQVP